MKKDGQCSAGFKHFRDQKHGSVFGGITLILFLVGIALLRKVVVHWLFPSGEILETLAFTVQHGTVPVAEAVAAFCREVVTGGA